MRPAPGTPNGLTEFLVVETLAWAGDTGANELSLNFCALTDFLAPERVQTPVRRLVRRGLLLADNVFQLERLYSFNRKFFPEWRRRYICVERFTDLPAVGLAYLHAESLLVPPGPWTRRREQRRRAAAEQLDPARDPPAHRRRGRRRATDEGAAATATPRLDGLVESQPRPV